MWYQKKTEIDGYLFFGNPNERSTTQPPREYYLYFIDPFRKNPGVTTGKEDEVFFQLKDFDESFEENLRNYSAAKELSLIEVQEYKTVYNQLAQKYQKVLTGWLKDNLSNGFQVSYKNSSKLFTTWAGSINLRELSGISGSETLTFKQQIDTLSSGLLSDYFSNQKPDYPAFSIKVTAQNRRQTVQEALKAIVKGQITGQANAVLSALDLLTQEGLSVEHSKVCAIINTVVNAKQVGQVVNRNELVSKKNDREFIASTALEVDFLPIFLAAMISEGLISLSVGSERITASNLDSVLSIGFSQLLDFSHIKRAEGFPLLELKALFAILELRTGLIVQVQTRNDAIKALMDRADFLIKECTRAEQKIRNGFFVWETKLISEAKSQEYIEELRKIKDFLETISRYNTPAKIINFKKTIDEIESLKDSLTLLQTIESMEAFVVEFQPLTTYLARAEGEISGELKWKDDYNTTHTNFLSNVKNDEPWAHFEIQTKLKTELMNLKTRYKNDYLEIHKQFRLGPKAQSQKEALKKDSRVEVLRALSSIEILPAQQFRSWEDTLIDLKNCTLLTMADLDYSPKCTHCGFERKNVVNTTVSADQRLADLDAQLDDLLKNWKATLRENMEDPTIQFNIDLLGDKSAAQIIKDFISGMDLPEVINANLLQAIKDILKGLDRVSIKKEELYSSLNQSGLPITPNELRERFNSYLETIIAGREEKQIRIVMEE